MLQLRNHNACRQTQGGARSRHHRNDTGAAHITLQRRADMELKRILTYIAIAAVLGIVYAASSGQPSGSYGSYGNLPVQTYPATTGQMNSGAWSHTGRFGWVGGDGKGCYYAENWSNC
jgi:hypothetical protein